MSARDVVDFLEFDLEPDVWINRLLAELANGTYEPVPPQRYWIAKGNGFSRQMTLPGIPDLVLYRAIVDYLYRKARYREHKHVYFDRRILHAAQAQAATEAQADITNMEPQVADSSRGFDTTSTVEY
ncbi:MAG TPA: hypothetical protein VNF29_01110 [Candidatus Binataceae bacterium]|nr:hypothetical protein [Candidatus Binataceae bacterium]